MVASCAWWVLAGMFVFGAIAGGSLSVLALSLVAVSTAVDRGELDEFLG